MEFVEQYTNFKPHLSRPSANTRNAGSRAERSGKGKHCIVLTGATSTIGAHILSHLQRENQQVKMIYCLLPPQEILADGIIRAAIEPINRKQRHLGLPFRMTNGIEAMWTNSAQEHLGLDENIYKMLCENVTAIIDTAFVGAISGDHFQAYGGEEQHLKSLHNLIQLSLDVGTSSPASLIFLSPYKTFIEGSGWQDDEQRASTLRTLGAAPDIMASAQEKFGANADPFFVQTVPGQPATKDIAAKDAAAVVAFALDGDRGNKEVRFTRI